jgi:hypothetical protein
VYRRWVFVTLNLRRDEIKRKALFPPPVDEAALRGDQILGHTHGESYRLFGRM